LRAADCVQLGSSSSDGGGHVKKCRRLIASIYLRVADDLVSNEATRLGSLSAPSMRNMLHSATFHRSMLVCSSLVVASTETAAAAAAGGHSTGAGGAAVLTVDALTTALSVPAFEVCKVLNPFQKLIVPVRRGLSHSYSSNKQATQFRERSRVACCPSFSSHNPSFPGQCNTIAASSLSPSLPPLSYCINRSTFEKWAAVFNLMSCTS
jgi:hypothetical protein